MRGLHVFHVLHGTILLLLGCVTVTSEHLYGLSLHWRPTNGTQIAFSYRLIWEKGAFQSCFPPYGPLICEQLYLSGFYSPTRQLHQWTGYTWQCTAGCKTRTLVSNMSDLYLTDVSRFLELEWQSAIEMKMFTFEPTDDLANVRISFHDDQGRPVPGIGDAHLSMAERNDTGRANISPMLNVFPVYRVPLECSIHIKLFPFDGDGDYVRCHWEAFPLPDNVTSQAVLNEDLCEMTVKADSSQGFKVGQQLSISLYAEDYSLKPVRFSGLSNDISTGPFSRTPIKFLVHVGNTTASPGDCEKGPRFTVEGTLEPYHKQSYQLPFKNAKLPFEIPGKTDRILSTGPRLMHFRTRQNMTTINEGTWDDIRDPAMKGIHQACGIAYTSDGVPGESRCAVLMVSEPDECTVNPCTRAPNGVCDNLFEYNTCTYPGDAYYTGSRWHNCRPVEKTKDNTALKVGLPVGISLLLLIIIITTAIYLKRYWMEQLKESRVQPGTGNRNGAGKDGVLPVSVPGEALANSFSPDDA